MVKLRVPDQGDGGILPGKQHSLMPTHLNLIRMALKDSLTTTHISGQLN